jgi:protein-S-isoprenylcysteine O-methyltransferase Ste14
MTFKLIFQLVVSFVMGMAVFFGTAGTFDYWQAWVYCGILFIPMFLATVYFARRDPELIERRMRTKEKEKEQKSIIRMLNTLTLIGFVLPGLDRRFGWSNVPSWVSLVSLGVVLVGYLFIYWVMKTNRFASRTVEVDKGQTVVTTGPYQWVRHPMYVGGLLFLYFTPFAVGSYWAFLAFVPILPLIILRILNEEKVLRERLPGYADYCLKTRSRLIPGVW